MTATHRKEVTMSENITPKVLADEIGVDAKVLRAYLRKEFARSPEAKNTSWLITPAAADAARAKFAKQETPAGE
jgi:flagellar biosynthesis/type III secretory pathway protein FliH